MPKPKASVDYNKCDPKSCSQDGVCPAAEACELNILKQDAPGEEPYTTSAPCRSCFKCIGACPKKAIVKM